MILFWVICAGLVAIALAFVLPPLLQATKKTPTDGGEQEANVDIYRDQLSELAADLANGIVSQEQYEQDRNEIERRLLDDVAASEKAGEVISASPVNARVPAYVVALGLPLIAVGLYLLVGNSAALSGSPTALREGPFAGGPPGNGQMTQPAIDANVAALAKRLEQNPGDSAGWIMLGRSYLSQEKFTDAGNAYAKAVALKKDDPDLLADYAFALAMANGRQLQGQPMTLILQALQLDPKNAKALELAGSAEFQAKNYKPAIEYWQRLLALTPADSELAQSVSQRITEAKSLDGKDSK